MNFKIKLEEKVLPIEIFKDFSRIKNMKFKYFSRVLPILQNLRTIQVP